MKGKVVVFVAVILLTVIHLYQLRIPALSPGTWNPTSLDPLYFLWQDASITQNVILGLSQDPFDAGPVWYARAFHNKITAAVEVAFQNIARPADLAFLFTFPGQVSTYDSYYKPMMLYPLEIIFTVVSLVLFVQHARLRGDTFVKSASAFFLITLLFLAITSPVMHILKMVLIVFSVRLFYISVLAATVWKKQKGK